MSKRSMAILVAAALALTAISLALSRRDSGDWRASQARRLFPFPWREVASIRIEKPDGDTVDLVRDPGGEWMVRLADGRKDSLNPQAEEDLSALVMLPWREPREKAGRPDEARSARVVAASFAGERVEMTIGSSGDGPPVAAIDGEPDIVFGIVPDLVRVVDWPPERFRNLGLANAGPGKKPVRVILSAQPSQIVDMAREGSAWVLKSPVVWPADPDRVAYLLGWLDRLRADAIVADGVDDPERFGFGPESAFVEAHFEDESGRTVRRVEFGGRVDGSPDQLYARVNGREPLFAVSRFVFAEIGMDQSATRLATWADFYRRRTLDLLDSGLPRRLVIEKLLPAPERLVIERQGEGEDAKWTGALEKGGAVQVFPVDPPLAEASSRPLAALLNGLAGLRVRQFLADTPPGPETIRWTAYPAWRILATGADGGDKPALVLYATDADGDLPPGRPYVEGKAGPVPMTPVSGSGDLLGMAASVEGRPVVVEVHGDLAYSLCLPPYRYRTLRMVDLDHDDWSRVVFKKAGSSVSYVRGGRERGEQWWRDGETMEPLVDDNNRFLALLSDLAQLRASGIAAEGGGDPAEFGLDQPEITVIVYGAPERREETSEPAEERRALVLSVGSGVEDGEGRYARLGDSGVVFLIPGELAAALAGEYR